MGGKKQASCPLNTITNKNAVKRNNNAKTWYSTTVNKKYFRQKY